MNNEKVVFRSRQKSFHLFDIFFAVPWLAVHFCFISCPINLVLLRDRGLFLFWTIDKVNILHLRGVDGAKGPHFPIFCSLNTLQRAYFATLFRYEREKVTGKRRKCTGFRLRFWFSRRPTDSPNLIFDIIMESLFSADNDAKIRFELSIPVFEKINLL